MVPRCKRDSSKELRAARLEMVRRQIAARGVRDKGVLGAMRTVPRHEFVDPDDLDCAYDDRPLRIGYGQTISQPFIVAHMTELLELRGGERVLEVGTGSGYQAAVLAELVSQVYSVEIVAPLANDAARTLHRLAYRNIVVRFGDGADGWPDAAPFDRIMVTAAPGVDVPHALVEQLADGGRLVAPVGGGEQHLVIVTRDGQSFQRRRGVDVRFVPLTGSAGR